MKKQWIITQNERDQCFVDAIQRIRENVEILKGAADETICPKESIELLYNQIIKDLKALKLYR